MAFMWGTLDDGRKYLTHSQLCNDPEAREFYNQHKDSFKPANNADIMVYQDRKQMIWDTLKEAAR